MSSTTPLTDAINALTTRANGITGASDTTLSDAVDSLIDGYTSATAHTIYFEFTDETNTTITAYYDGTFISDAIRATVPRIYGNKTVSLAQLDNVTWYELSNIPLNTELVDYNTITTGYKLNDNGAMIEGNAWDCVTDYIFVDPSMAFAITCRDWTNIGIYDSNKNFITVVSSHNVGGTTTEDGFVQFTVAPSSLPSNAAYVMLVGNAYDIERSLSVIRTA